MSDEKISKKDRIFVRGMVSGDYGLQQELQRLRSLPRVIKTDEIPWHGGPQQFGKFIMDPRDGLSQSLQMHIEDFSPGGHSKKHGHQNEAVFYILEGNGYEIHDGQRYDWEAGDVVVVHNSSVHQHFNADPDQPARALVLKTKPLFMFMNLIFQKELESSPKEPIPGWEDYRPVANSGEEG